MLPNNRLTQSINNTDSSDAKILREIDHNIQQKTAVPCQYLPDQLRGKYTNATIASLIFIVLCTISESTRELIDAYRQKLKIDFMYQLNQFPACSNDQGHQPLINCNQSGCAPSDCDTLEKAEDNYNNHELMEYMLLLPMAMTVLIVAVKAQRAWTSTCNPTANRLIKLFADATELHTQNQDNSKLFDARYEKLQIRDEILETMHCPISQALPTIPVKVHSDNNTLFNLADLATYIQYRGGDVPHPCSVADKKNKVINITLDNIFIDKNSWSSINNALTQLENTSSGNMDIESGLAGKHIEILPSNQTILSQNSHSSMFGHITISSLVEPLISSDTTRNNDHQLNFLTSN